METQTKLYDIIYADPPWSYEHNPPQTTPLNHYETMSLDEIKDIEIPSRDNCILYLWAPAPILKRALIVLQVWGFKYKTCMIWDKESYGIGYWSRVQHEILLIGTKGKVHPPPIEKRIRSIVRCKRKISSQHLPPTHSIKPQIFRNLIDDMFPDKEKIELFARGSSVGWDVQGNEVGAKHFTLEHFGVKSL